jgi:hypothetical protein
MRKISLLFLIGLSIGAGVIAADKPEKPEKAWMQAKLSDLGSPAYADIFPSESDFSQPIHTPCGNTIAFRLNLLSPTAAKVRFEPRNFLRVNDKLKSGIKLSIQPMLTVHVEGNTQGPVMNYPGGEPPEIWKSYQIRPAPFDLFEAVDDAVCTEASLEAGCQAAFLITAEIPVHTEKGIYQGDFVIESPDRKQIRLPIMISVSSIRLPERFSLDSNHWLWPEPVNLTTGKAPEYWSEEHWQLLEHSGRALLKSGDNMIYTPIIFAEVPLIQTVKTGENTYEFDFTGFRRWVATFRKIGFKYFAGTHMSSWMLPLYVKDQASGERRKVELDTPEFLAVLNAFLPRLNSVLREMDLVDSYRQYQKDEPREKDFESYKRYAEVRRKHLPGIRSIDAVLDRDGKYAELVDIQVLNLFGAYLQREKIKAHPTRYWLYCCTSPYPPFPNRHLDRFPVENRFWPLLAADFGATGFLNWAANIYRGVNEYDSSLGPLPNGSQRPGHPPGDNWFFYRGPNGLRTGVRMLNYRDGMVDATLFSLLEKKNPETAKRILQRVIFPELYQACEFNFGWKDAAGRLGKTYSTAPAQYNILRGELLSALEAEGKE